MGEGRGREEGRKGGGGGAMSFDNIGVVVYARCRNGIANLPPSWSAGFRERVEDNAMSGCWNLSLSLSLFCFFKKTKKQSGRPSCTASEVAGAMPQKYHLKHCALNQMDLQR